MEMPCLESKFSWVQPRSTRLENQHGAQEVHTESQVFPFFFWFYLAVSPKSLLSVLQREPPL